MPQKSKKETEAKAAKKRCWKCGESFRTKALRLNHETNCQNLLNVPENNEALQKAWSDLTVEQQAQYGTPQKLHEACIKMLRELPLNM